MRFRDQDQRQLSILEPVLLQNCSDQRNFFGQDDTVASFIDIGAINN